MPENLLDVAAVAGGAILLLVLALFFLNYALEQREWKKGRPPVWFNMGASDPHEGCLIFLALAVVCYFLLFGERLFRALLGGFAP